MTTALTTPYRVAVAGTDPISEAGLAAQLRGRPGILVVENDGGHTDVIVAGINADDDGIAYVRRLVRGSTARVVALVNEIDDAGVLRLAEAGATGVIRRADSTPEMLVDIVGKAARNEGSLPPDLLGGLLRQVKSLHQHVLSPRGLSLRCLSDREVSVLSLVADGKDTKAIANELCYSERTIKNVLHDVMRRFGLKNRSHAVAFALREGLI